MAVHRITKSFVDGAKPDPRRVQAGAATFFFDDRLTGFGLKVTPDGAKSYVAQYRDGRGRGADKVRKVIGRHGDPWTADTARAEADRILSAATLGRSAVHQERAEKQALTVADLCEQYLKAAAAGVPMGRGSRARAKKPLTIRYDRGRIARHIIPLLGKMSVKKVTSADVRKFVDDIVTGETAIDEARTETNGVRKHGRLRVEGGPGAARRALELLGGIFAYGRDRGLCDSPTHGVAKPVSEAKDRFLNADELQRLGAALTAAETEGESVDFCQAIRLIALTGCRRNEILNLKWSEVDIGEHSIHLEDSKTGKSKRPIGKAAMDLLQVRAANKKPDQIYVFESRKKPGQPMVGVNNVFERIAAAAKIDDASLHTLRHSLATHANDLGYGEATIAGILGHKLQSITSRYTHKIDRALILAADDIAGHIARMLDGRPLEDSADVVDLSRRRA
jgi:integrase